MAIDRGRVEMSDLQSSVAGGEAPLEMFSAFLADRYVDSSPPLHIPVALSVAPLDEAELQLRQCLDRIARGDEDALAELYDATATRVHAAAMRILRTDAAASEVVSDVYFQVWKSAVSFDSQRGSVGTWLLMICRSRALDRLRQRDPAVSHPDPHVLAGDASGDADPQDLVSALERGTRVREGLQRLAPAHRQVVALAFFRGFTHVEIAQHLDLTLGTVKSMLRQSMHSLRVFLESGGPGGMNGHY